MNFWRLHLLKPLLDIKRNTKRQLFNDAKKLHELINEYKQFSADPYDFVKDPNGELKWHMLAKNFVMIIN